MRRKINNKLKQYLLELNSKYTIDELLPIINKKFKENYTRLQLQKYLVRNKIPYKYANKKMIRNIGDRIAIGTEYTKPDGMVLVKVEKNKWEYKQRLIYEKYYNVKLKEDEYVIFLDDNRNNFNINNLKVVTRQEAGYIGSFKTNYDINKSDKETTETLLKIANLLIKTKSIKK